MNGITIIGSLPGAPAVAARKSATTLQSGHRITVGLRIALTLHTPFTLPRPSFRPHRLHPCHAMSETDARREAALTWLAPHAAALDLDLTTLRPASADASFRRYFRLDAGKGSSLILMDAPPDKEDSSPFLHAQRIMAQAGVHVPAIVREDLGAGFLLLEDFGDRTYLDALNADSARPLYGDATAALVRLQVASRPDVFPAYDRALLMRELQLFPDWYLERHKGETLTDADRRILADTFETIVARTVSQPSVYVHRDYHSRNLMVLDGEANPGVIDFQDAVHGPITYDLVSLLKDAYVRWDEERILDLAIRYWEAARRARLPVPAAFGDFYSDFEWMGLQRHLKVLGIFARLNYRDGKDRYLADLPRVLGYTLDVVRRYTALAPLCGLLERVEGAVPEQGFTF